MAILCILLYLLCIWRWFKIKSKEVKTNKQTPNRRLQWLTAEPSWTSLIPHLALLVTTSSLFTLPLLDPLQSPHLLSVLWATAKWVSTSRSLHSMLFFPHNILSCLHKALSSFSFSSQLKWVTLGFFIFCTTMWNLPCLPVCYLSFFSKCELSESKDIVFFTPIYPTARVLPGA